MTIYLFSGYDRHKPLSILCNLSRSKQLDEAKRLVKQHGIVTGRDVLGGLRFEVRSPAHHTNAAAPNAVQTLIY